MIRALIDRLLGHGRERASRLTAEEAIALARAAAAGDALAGDLGFTENAEREGRVVWIVTSRTMGLQLRVIVDDASGSVLEKQVVGLR